MLRRMIRPPGFKTFEVNFLKFPSKTAHKKIYGFRCSGPFVLDGLQYISKNLDHSLIIPYSTSYMMNINGENKNALNTKMEDTNIIYPIFGSPVFSMFMILEQRNTISIYKEHESHDPPHQI
tara:strand:+ start:183 stop:548 length:366 start_codon:yes stop_codon:yes gene_type:complete